MKKASKTPPKQSLDGPPSGVGWTQMCVNRAIFCLISVRKLALPPGKRAPNSTHCQRLYLCEVLRAEDQRADFRRSNNSARSRSGANEEPLVSCHSTRTELPGSTTSRGRVHWADWFQRRAPSGPNPRPAATAGKTPADRGDSAAWSACASRPRVLPESSPRAKEWMASHMRPTPNRHRDEQNPRPVQGCP